MFIELSYSKRGAGLCQVIPGFFSGISRNSFYESGDKGVSLWLESFSSPSPSIPALTISPFVGSYIK